MGTSVSAAYDSLGRFIGIFSSYSQDGADFYYQIAYYGNDLFKINTVTFDDESVITFLYNSDGNFIGMDGEEPSDLPSEEPEYDPSNDDIEITYSDTDEDENTGSNEEEATEYDKSDADDYTDDDDYDDDYSDNDYDDDDDTNWDDYWNDYTEDEYARLVEINEVNIWGQPVVKGNSYNGLALVETFAYAVDGNYAAASTNFDGIETLFGFNAANGQKESEQLGTLTPLQNFYDASGALVAVTQAVEGLSNGTGFTNYYNYSKDRLVGISHNGVNYEFTYDAYGNALASKLDGTALWTNTYANPAKGDVGTLVYANGDTVTYTYVNGKIAAISYDGGAQTAFEYEHDSNGNISKITDNINDRVTSFGHETYGETYYEIADSDGKIYYRRGQPSGTSSVEEFFGLVFYLSTQSSTDNASGNVTTTSTASYGDESRSFTRVEDIFGRAIQKQIRNDSEQVLINNELEYVDISDTRTTNQLAAQHITTYNADTDTFSVKNYEMEYDDRGNVRSISVDNQIQFRYTYNGANMLVREDNYPDGKSTVFDYDVGGNMTNRKSYYFTLEDEFGDSISEINYYYDGDRLVGISDGLIHIEYDAAGNATNYKTVAGLAIKGQTGTESHSTSQGSFEWEGRSLVKASGQANLWGDTILGDVTYGYDADGLRQTKNICVADDTGLLGDTNIHYEYIWDGTTFVGYIISFPSSETGVMTNIVTRVVYSDRGESLGYFYAVLDDDGNVTSTDMVWYLKNTLGDITGLYSEEEQHLDATYTYDAWGVPTLHKAVDMCTAADNYRIKMYKITSQLIYRGYYYDAETGLYYLQSRYYAPSWGRFINADKHFDTGTGILGTNMYIYCDDNPVRWTDVSGEGADGEKEDTFTKVYITSDKKTITTAQKATITLRVTTGSGKDITTDIIKDKNNIKWEVSYSTGNDDEPTIGGKTKEVKSASARTIYVKVGVKRATCHWTAPLPINVTAVAVTGVTISPTSKEMIRGQNYTLTATVSPDTATNKNVTWTTSDSSIAKVENGKVIAQNNSGTATIRATSNSNSSKYSECTIKVRAFSWPVTNVYALSDVWGYRGAASDGHNGIDIIAASGTKVKSVMVGVVYIVGDQGSVNYGKYIDVKHTFNGVTYYSRYAHLSVRSVKVGDKVSAGTVIGEVGQTGSANGPHLHFEITKTWVNFGGKSINPTALYHQLDKRYNTAINTKPLFVKNSSNAYVYNTAFVWNWSENPLPEWYSHDEKYKNY
jgi:RHS repeat-associated protein